MQAKLEKNRTGKWEIRYSERQRDGTWRSRTVSTRTDDWTDAQRFLTGWLDARRQAAAIGPATVGDLAEAYLQHLQQRSARDTSIRITKRVVSVVGPDTPVAQITSAGLAGYADMRETVLGSRGNQPSWRRELSALNALLRYGVKTGVIKHAPFVPVPAANRPRDVWLDEAQAKRLLSLAAIYGGYMELFVPLALYTGARSEAIERLQWSMVDLQAQTIDYRHSGAGTVTKKRRVVVPIHPNLLPVLRAAKLQAGTEPYVFGGSTASKIYKDWAKMIRGTEFERMGLTRHDLRRTFGTLLARAGTPLWEIAGLMGDTIETATKHYLHHSPSHLRRAMGNLAI